MNKNSKKLLQEAMTFTFSKILSDSPLPDKKLEQKTRAYLQEHGSALGLSIQESNSIATSINIVARQANHRYKQYLRSGAPREKAKEAAYRVLMNTKNYDSILHSVNRAERHRVSMNKKAHMKKAMNANRESNHIFYLCSEHANPAKDHAPYQGKLYVDRFWRNTLEKHGNDPESVERFIRVNNIMTIQKVCSAPIYMVFRPYCKHYFIPVDTKKAMSTDLSELKKTVHIVEKPRRARKKNYYLAKMKIKNNIGKMLKRC